MKEENSPTFNDLQKMQALETFYNTSLSEVACQLYQIEHSLNFSRITQSRRNSGVFSKQPLNSARSDHVERVLEANQFLRAQNLTLRQEIAHLREDRAFEKEELKTKTQAYIRKISHLETQLKREIQKRNRFRMTIHSLELFFQNLASQIKSVRLKIMTPQNIDETLAKFQITSSPSIQKFCHELRQFIRSLFQDFSKLKLSFESEGFESISHIEMSKLLPTFGPPSPMRKSTKSANQIFEYKSPFKVNHKLSRNRLDLSKTVALHEMPLIQSHESNQTQKNISRTSLRSSNSKILLTDAKKKGRYSMDFNDMVKIGDDTPTDKKSAHQRKRSGPFQVGQTNQSRRTTLKMNPLSPNPLDVVSCWQQQAMHHDNSSSLQQEFNQQGILNRSMSLDLLDLDLVTKKQRNSEQSSPQARPVPMMKSASSLLGKPPRPPNWIPNEHSKVCMRCQAKFTLFNWRHHCRKCGQLVCRYCSKGKEYVVGYSQKVRICDMCQAKIKNERFHARKHNKATLHLGQISEEN